MKQYAEEYKQTAQEMLLDHVNKIFAPLNERQKFVLSRRFGLVDGRERTLGEIGEELGMQERGRPLTVERIRQIEAEALAKLRASENSQRLREELAQYGIYNDPTPDIIS